MLWACLPNTLRSSLTPYLSPKAAAWRRGEDPTSWQLSLFSLLSVLGLHPAALHRKQEGKSKPMFQRAEHPGVSVQWRDPGCTQPLQTLPPGWQGEESAEDWRLDPSSRMTSPGLSHSNMTVFLVMGKGRSPRGEATWTCCDTSPGYGPGFCHQTVHWTWVISHSPLLSSRLSSPLFYFRFPYPT